MITYTACKVQRHQSNIFDLVAASTAILPKSFIHYIYPSSVIIKVADYFQRHNQGIPLCVNVDQNRFNFVSECRVALSTP